jgi:hypothetical protein
VSAVSRQASSTRLAAVLVLALVLGLGGCGRTSRSARSVVDAALARTEAAGSAHFVTEWSVIGGTSSEALGSVNFARSQLAYTLYGVASGNGSEDVRQIGHALYHKFVLAPTNPASPGGVVSHLGLSHWEVQGTNQPVTAPMGPLGALLRTEGVAVVGSAELSGVKTTAYRVSVPGSALSGVHEEPYFIYVWLDNKGRIYNMSAKEVQTGTKGPKAPLRTSISTTLADFGAPVDVQVPVGARTMR